ncbi:hypothetical protein GQ457_08G021550 [Hibiscus cannabinus]
MVLCCLHSEVTCSGNRAAGGRSGCCFGGIYINMELIWPGRELRLWEAKVKVSCIVVLVRGVKSGTRSGFRSGKIGYGSFQVGLFQVGFEADNWQVNSGSGRLQVGFISGRFHFRSGNFRSISFNVGLIGFRICIKFETLSLVQILDRRRRCLVG